MMAREVPAALSAISIAMSDLYDADILEWSQQQAARLRRLAAGERLNEASPDWTNIIEEVESVGPEQLHAVGSLPVQALLHMLEVHAWPLSTVVPQWQAEARVFRADARRRFVPSMRERTNLASIHRDALRGLPETIDGQAPLPVPPTCEVTLDERLGDGRDRLWRRRWTNFRPMVRPGRVRDDMAQE
jgi:hypothetical protein